MGGAQDAYHFSVGNTAGDFVYFDTVWSNHQLPIGILLPPQLPAADGLGLLALSPGAARDEVGLDEAAQVVVGAVLAGVTAVGRGAAGGVVAGVLPGPAGEGFDDGVERGQDGGVVGAGAQQRLGGGVAARQRREGRQGAVGAQDVGEEHGGLDGDRVVGAAWRWHDGILRGLLLLRELLSLMLLLLLPEMTGCGAGGGGGVLKVGDDELGG